MSLNSNDSSNSRTADRPVTEFEHGHLSDLGAVGRAVPADGTELNTSQLFDLLKNRRRRSVTRFLYENDGNAVLSDLAEHIAAEENDITVQQLSSTERKRVYIALYQCHLPKMASLGVIDYDKNRGTVELRASASRLLQYINTDEDGREGNRTRGGNGTPDRAWVAPAIAAFVFLTVSVGALGIGPLAAASATTWTLLGLVGVVAIIGCQYVT
ncbi:DUF7344 domain-containing protein [Halorubrum kocurii]|uniref:DUF7344 domain-containing protein n=1 Tax=Halorubrum kocurii JCM 14978 TaxID=1230456 RepID=M0P7U2_9EURY|nr:hypothetical protein [Halorubrum kocurii]EMA64900.1 hypothetical protein C468_07996 [Halorubrum kocurii JCM 14978]